jgi:hypothetical protein
MSTTISGGAAFKSVNSGSQKEDNDNLNHPQEETKGDSNTNVKRDTVNTNNTFNPQNAKTHPKKEPGGGEETFEFEPVDEEHSDIERLMQEMKGGGSRGDGFTIAIHPKEGSKSKSSKKKEGFFGEGSNFGSNFSMWGMFGSSTIRTISVTKKEEPSTNEEPSMKEMFKAEAEKIMQEYKENPGNFLGFQPHTNLPSVEGKMYMPMDAYKERMENEKSGNQDEFNFMGVDSDIGTNTNNNELQGTTTIKGAPVLYHQNTFEPVNFKDAHLYFQKSSKTQTGGENLNQNTPGNNTPGNESMEQNEGGEQEEEDSEEYSGMQYSEIQNEGGEDEEEYNEEEEDVVESGSEYKPDEDEVGEQGGEEEGEGEEVLPNNDSEPEVEEVVHLDPEGEEGEGQEEKSENQEEKSENQEEKSKSDSKSQEEEEQLSPQENSASKESVSKDFVHPIPEYVGDVNGFVPKLCQEHLVGGDSLLRFYGHPENSKWVCHGNKAAQMEQKGEKPEKEGSSSSEEKSSSDSSADEQKPDESDGEKAEDDGNKSDNKSENEDEKSSSENEDEKSNSSSPRGLMLTSYDSKTLVPNFSMRKIPLVTLAEENDGKAGGMCKTGEGNNCRIEEFVQDDFGLEPHEQPALVATVKGVK